MKRMQPLRPNSMTQAFSIAGLAFAIVATGYGYQANKTWPPGLQKVSDESPVLSPEDSMKTFFMPPGIESSWWPASR